MNIAKFVENLKEIEKFQRSQKAYKIKQNRPDHAKRHEKTANQVTEIIDFLETLPADEAGNYITAPHNNNEQCSDDVESLFSFAASDIDALPKEVRESLNLNPTDELETRVIELIRIAGRPLSVRELIVGLYRKYGHEVTQRNPFASKLYRMSNSGALVTVPDKRGYYDLPKSSKSNEGEEVSFL